VTPLDVALQAARSAGNIIMNLRDSVEVSRKSPQELVTQVDLAAQSAIVEQIRRHFPDDSVLAEEGMEAPLGSERLWVIDPLDGTHNYIHGVPHYSVSIARMHNGVPELGVVYDPCRGEIFTATRGGGAYLDGHRISVSPRPDLHGSFVTAGFYYDRGQIIRDTLDAVERLFVAGIGDIRRTGSAALDLCWVGCGRFDAYVEYKLCAWDYAAGWLVCTEAGGACSAPYGDPMTLEARGVLASNGHMHREFVEVSRRRGIVA